MMGSIAGILEWTSTREIKHTLYKLDLYTYEVGTVFMDDTTNTILVVVDESGQVARIT